MDPTRATAPPKSELSWWNWASILLPVRFSRAAVSCFFAERLSGNDASLCNAQPGVDFFGQSLLHFLQQLGAAVVHDQKNEIAQRCIPAHLDRQFVDDFAFQIRADGGRLEEIPKIGRSVEGLDKFTQVGLHLLRLDLLERHVGERRRVPPCHRFVQFAPLSSSRTKEFNKKACASG